jgi:hypothetical protein
MNDNVLVNVVVKGLCEMKNNEHYNTYIKTLENPDVRKTAEFPNKKADMRIYATDQANQKIIGMTKVLKKKICFLLN